MDESPYLSLSPQALELVVCGVHESPYLSLSPQALELVVCGVHPVPGINRDFVIEALVRGFIRPNNYGK